ncbi:MFS transporter [Tistrella bauzanensis]|uniref:MFS transporter n=1 Tax=Tistrella bauzanensis TaxID=657419 RepID=A0ABQ1I834_9PROT|nr:MFS transporter [Tistrella bauzanensis]GGB26233.1 MFS transporter [Tistrella bauzanensis]
MSMARGTAGGVASGRAAGRMPRSLVLIVISAGCILALSMGVRQSLGLYLTPVSEAIGTGREYYALSMGLMNLMWGIFAPFAGIIADKHGPMKVGLAGGLFYAVGVIWLALSGSALDLAGAGILIGIGLSGAGFTVILGAVGRAASEKHRASALALASLGSSIGQFVALPYAHGITDVAGWWWSLLILGVTSALMVPLAMGLRGAAKAGDPITSKQTVGEAVREAFTTPGFWLLNAGFFVCGFHLAFIAVHLPAYAADKGLAPWVATAALTAIGLGNIFGTYGFAKLGTVIQRKEALALLYTIRALVFVGFLMLPLTPALVIGMSFLLGLTWLGTVPLTSGLVAHMFGPVFMSTLFGLVFMGHQLGGFLGSWLAGRIFDSVGSYDPVWWLSVGLGLLSALLHILIREKPVARLRASAALA